MPAKYSEKEKENDSSESRAMKNNWKAFLLSLLVSFIIVSCVGLLGANFVFFTRLSNLDKMFPTDEKTPPYTEPPISKSSPTPTSTTSSNIKMKGGNKMNGENTLSMCGKEIDFTESPIYKNKYFRGMFEYGLPYSLESDKGGALNTIENWLINKTKFSYIWLRRFIKYIIELTGSTCDLLPESMINMPTFILAPLCIAIIIAVSSLWWLPTLVTTFTEETGGKYATMISILGLFFGWTWVTPVILSMFQLIGVLFSFIILPLLTNSDDLKKIVTQKYNSYYLLILFLLLTTIGAFIHLDIIVAVVMTVVFIVSTIHQIRSSGNST